MKKYTLMFLGVFSAVAMSACGPDNVATCTEKVEAVNALECIDDDSLLDIETQCPESLNDSTIDQSEYYDCVYGQYTCNGDDGSYAVESADCTVATE